MISSTNNVVSNSFTQTLNTVVSEPETSEPPVFKEESATHENTPMEKAQDNAVIRRDKARMVALEAEAIKHANNLVNTYQNASSNSDSDNSGNISFSPETKNIYNTVLSYSQRIDLIRYLEGNRPEQQVEPSNPIENSNVRILEQTSISVYA